jgi:phage terminase large subunit
MQIDLSKLPDVTNPAFYPLFKNKDRYLVLWGSAGSGKSYFAAEKVLARVLVGMARGIRHKIVCLRKTQPDARRSLFSLFLEYVGTWGLEDIVDKLDQKMTLRFPNGSEIICTGLDDPMKLKSIHGITGFVMEEASEFGEDDITQVDLRLRGKLPDYKQIVFLFNPISEDIYLKHRFFDLEDLKPVKAISPRTERLREQIETDEGPVELFTTRHHSTYHDNQFIDREYKAVLEGLQHKDIYNYTVYALGQWGVLRGLIYENWDMTDAWPEDEFELHGYGLDFGFSPGHKAAIVEVGFVGQHLYEREVLYESGLTNQQIAGRFKDAVEGWESAFIVADSAEPKSIKELRAEGLNVVGATKGADSVSHGIQQIRQYAVHIFRSSVNLAREKRAYHWETNRSGQTLDRPAKFQDDLMDAERYIVGRLKGRTPIKLTWADKPEPRRRPESDKTVVLRAADVVGKEPEIPDEPDMDLENEDIWTEL